MSNYLTDIRADALLAALEKESLVAPADAPQLAHFIQAQQQEKELPLYLRILVGIGAFIASLCFISFLTLSDLLVFESKGLIPWGCGFIAVAILLARKSSSDSETAMHSFLLQSSFCAMSVGKMCFVFGVTGLMSSPWSFTLATLAVTLATYHVYRMSIDRFLSTLAVILSAFGSLMGTHAAEAVLSVNLFLLAQILLTAVLFTHPKLKRAYIPLAYAAACSLCVVMLYLTSAPFYPVYVNLVLTLALIALIGWASGSVRRLRTEPLLLASLGAALLGVISAYGILLALGLMLLGYARHERLLLLLGTLLSPVFIFLYYYNLDIDLMAKAGVLVGSGAVLLLGYAYLAIKQLDREPV